MLVTRDGTTLRQLGAGDSFGELALLRNAPRSASVVALDDVTTWTLERDSFLTAVAYSPQWAQTVDDDYL